MFDIITFGSATRDLFVTSKEFAVFPLGKLGIKTSEFITGQGLCVSAGSKVYIDDLFFATGGGGTNTAATFSLQGLKTAYVGKVGNDPGGQALIGELKKMKINGFVAEDKNRQTAYSIILSAPEKERSILVYRGACHFLKKEEIPFDNLKTKWFYIAPLSGDCAELFEPLLDFAEKNKIRVAVNPGHSQLKLNISKLKPFLTKIDILILNQEEASELTGVPYQNKEELFRVLDGLVSGLAVMSRGPEGVIVSDGKNLYRAGIPESGLIDRTGAGDAFGSGFVAGFIQKSGDIKYAIQLGTANATSCVQKLGAKNGLLKKGEWGEWERVKVEVIKSNS